MRPFFITALTLAILFTSACGGKDDGGYPPSDEAKGIGTPSGQQQKPTPKEPSGPPTSIPSGMRGVPDIQVLKVHKTGEGERAVRGGWAKLKYKAMLANGKVIDAGLRPFDFQIGKRMAITGWDIVVARMRVGDSWTVRIPAALAYGAQGRGPVPPNSDMKFDMELLSVR